MNVRMTLFEGLISFAPFIEIHTSEKLPWVKTAAVHIYDKVPAPEELGNLLSEYADWQEQIV